MKGLGLFLHQLRYDQKLFWRNPATVLFSVGLPLVFLFLIGAAFVSATHRDAKYQLLGDQYLVPAIMTLGIVSATFSNLAMTLTYQREMGVLKRVRGTPLPTSIFVGARTASAVVNSMLIAVVIMIAGRLAYGVDITATRLSGMALCVIVGSVCFSALGFALTIVIPSQSAATPITNLIVLPLYFISGVFGEADNLPPLLYDLGRIFPIYHLGACLFTTFSPVAHGLGPSAKNLAIVMLWGLGGLIVASLWFKWDPQEGR